MRTARRVLTGAVATMAVAAGGLAGAEAASADWTSQYQTTEGKAWANCHERSGILGHGACFYVSYVTSGDYPGAPGNRYFRRNIHFTNHTCPVEYHISAEDWIFYADLAGPCF